MGSFSSGIANAIRQMGNAQAQGVLNRGNIYGNLAQDIGQAPMNYLAIQRGLRQNKHQDIVQGQQEKGINDDKELEALLAQAPPETDRLKLSLDFWQTRDQAKYHQLLSWATQTATQQYKSMAGTPGRSPVQAGVEAQLPANAMSPVVPLEQQQVPHAPVQFPGGYGQDPFTMTPPTEQQVNQQLGIRELIKAEGQRLATQPQRDLTASEGALNRQNRMDIAKLPKTDTSLSPTELFAQDPEKYGAMREIDEKSRAKYRREPRDPNQPTPYQSKRLEVDLRKEFNSSPIVKEYDDVRKQMARVESAIEQAKTSKNFVAIDQALINGLNKMIDPSSVVREGEYARTIQNSPLLSRALGKVDQIRTGGGGFTSEERTALVSMMRDFYKDAESLYTTHASEYERLAEGGGMDKSRIVIRRDQIAPKNAPPSGSSRIVQRNKTTGAIRHSDDGGQTWQPGP